MWTTNKGSCNCFYCQENKPHPTRSTHAMVNKRKHLQVAESLNPNDYKHTIMCPLCTHEIEVETKEVTL